MHELIIQQIQALLSLPTSSVYAVLARGQLANITPKQWTNSRRKIYLTKFYVIWCIVGVTLSIVSGWEQVVAAGFTWKCTLGDRVSYQQLPCKHYEVADTIRPGPAKIWRGRTPTRKHKRTGMNKRTGDQRAIFHEEPNNPELKDARRRK